MSTERLLATAAIHQLKARYCRYVDTKRWDALHALFSENARLDGFGSVPDGTTPSVFVAGIAARLAPAITIHHVQAPEIDFTGGDTARGVWSMMDYVDFGEPMQQPDGGTSRGWIGWGYYEETYVREGDGWRFAYMRLARQRLDPLSDDHPAATFGRHGPTPGWL